MKEGRGKGREDGRSEGERSGIRDGKWAGKWRWMKKTKESWRITTRGGKKERKMEARVEGKESKIAPGGIFAEAAFPSVGISFYGAINT